MHSGSRRHGVRESARLLAGAWRIEGAPYGSDVSFVVDAATPRRSRLAPATRYSETFVVQAGRGRFEVDGRPIVAVAGDVLVVPHETPHAFRALRAGRLQFVAIHAASRMEATWLAQGSMPEE